MKSFCYFLEDILKFAARRITHNVEEINAVFFGGVFTTHSNVPNSLQKAERVVVQIAIGFEKPRPPALALPSPPPPKNIAFNLYVIGNSSVRLVDCMSIVSVSHASTNLLVFYFVIQQLSFWRIVFYCLSLA